MDTYDYLTNEAKATLLTLYKVYHQQHDDNKDRKKARIFGSLPEVFPKYLSDLKNVSELDALDILNELHSEGWVKNSYGSDTITEIELLPRSISRMQNRFKNNFDSAIVELNRIKSLLF